MSDSQRVGSRVSQKLFKKYSVLDRNKYFWQTIVVAGNGNKLKLCKTPLFQISGSAGSSTEIEQFKLKFWKFFWGSDSQIFHFIPLPHHPFKVSMEKNFNNVEITEINFNATWIMKFLFLYFLILFGVFLSFVSVFIRKAQFVTRVTRGFFALFLPARWWQINVITLSSPNHTKQSIT